VLIVLNVWLCRLDCATIRAEDTLFLLETYLTYAYLKWFCCKVMWTMSTAKRLLSEWKSSVYTVTQMCLYIAESLQTFLLKTCKYKLNCCICILLPLPVSCALHYELLQVMFSFNVLTSKQNNTLFNPWLNFSELLPGFPRILENLGFFSWIYQALQSARKSVWSWKVLEMKA